MDLSFRHGPFAVTVTDEYDAVELASKETGDTAVLTTDVLPRGSAFVIVRSDASQGGTGNVVGARELRPTTEFDRLHTTDAYQLYYQLDVPSSGRLRHPDYYACFRLGLQAANEHAGPKRLAQVLGS